MQSPGRRFFMPPTRGSSIERAGTGGILGRIRASRLGFGFGVQAEFIGGGWALPVHVEQRIPGLPVGGRHDEQLSAWPRSSTAGPSQNPVTASEPVPDGRTPLHQSPGSGSSI